MKVKYLIIALLFIANFSFSQVKDSLKKDLNKGWYVGVNIAYSSINGFYSKYNHWLDQGFRSNSVSGSVGADWLYAFGRKHNLTFGIHYGGSSYSDSYYWGVDSLYNPNQISHTHNRYSNDYLLLPVHMDFCLFKGTVSPYIMTGFLPSISLSSYYYNRTTYVNGVKRETRQRYSHPELNLDWQFGIGVDVNLTKSRFRVFVYDSSSSGPLLYTLLSHGFWSYSIHTGISYYFKTSRR